MYMLVSSKLLQKMRRTCGETLVRLHPHTYTPELRRHLVDILRRTRTQSQIPFSSINLPKAASSDGGLVSEEVETERGTETRPGWLPNVNAQQQHDSVLITARTLHVDM